MLNNYDAKRFNRIYVALGYTDLRKGIDGLATLIKTQYDLDPFDKDTIFLFCGRRSNRIKALVWEGDGFLLLYKRVEAGGFQWPRSSDELRKLTPAEFHLLMQGFSIESRIKHVNYSEPA